LELKYSNQVKDEVVEPNYKTSKEITEERADKELLDELTTFLINPKGELKTA